MTTLPIEGTLKEAIFLKRANWAVSSFPNAPLLFLDRDRGVAAFAFPRRSSRRCAAAGQARLWLGRDKSRSPSGRGPRPRAGPAAEAAEQPESSNLPGSPRGPRHTMASGGSQSCEEEEEEEALKKLIVRLNNVQEGKQMDTLLQLLEDMLVFTYSDRGTAGSPSLL